DTIALRARHSGDPAQPKTAILHINHTLSGEWLLAQSCQSPKLSDHAGQDEFGRWREIMPIAFYFVPNRCPRSAQRRSNRQLRRMVLLGLKQNQKRVSFDRILAHS